MFKIYLLVLPVLLLSAEYEEPRQFDLSAFNSKSSKANEEASQNPHIKCRWVCDKKVYKEQKIDEAVSFYKKSKLYKFR